MSSPLQLEQNLIEAIRALTPEKQQSVLDFAEFLCSQQNQASSPQPVAEPITPTIVKEKTEATYNTVDLAEHEISAEQAVNLHLESNAQQSSTLNGASAEQKVTPLWEIFAQISAQVPDEEWQKIPTDLARRFDYYQQQRQSQA